MKIRPKLVPIDVHAACPRRTLTRSRVRQFEIPSDEPPDEGEDAAPRPLEVMLASLAGCSAVIAQRIAHERNIVIDGLAIDVRGHLDVRGTLGQADVPIPFPRIELAFRFATDGSAEAIAALKDTLAKRCPVQVILRAAGTVFEETWDVAYR